MKFHNFEICRNRTFENVLGLFLICLGVLVSPKINIIGVGRKGTVQKFRNHGNEEFGALIQLNLMSCKTNRVIFGQSVLVWSLGGNYKT